MRLIIGGANQGKLQWVLRQNHLTEEEVAETAEQACVRPVLNGLQEVIKQWLLGKKVPAKEMQKILKVNPNLIIICNEVGSGLVPLEPFERAWREETGRLCCILAKEAQQVERIFCGIAVTLKAKEGTPC